MVTTINQKAKDHFNPILQASSPNFHWKGKGTLSIKTFRNGRSYYNTGLGHYAVEEGKYLLLNSGQEYSITIESETPVESFCIFFPDGMVEEVYLSLVHSNHKLLEDPFFPKLSTLDFVEKTYIDDHILATISQLRMEYMEIHNDRIALEEKLCDIIEKLLQVHLQVYKEISKLRALRESTREELYKRLHIGHDFISAFYNKPISLSDIARAASLSPNHFLRNYKQLFGITPYQFLKEKRLQEAKKMLRMTDKSVTEICLEVGFQSFSSFSMLFSKRFAVSPSQVHKKSDF